MVVQTGPLPPFPNINYVVMSYLEANGVVGYTDTAVPPDDVDLAVQVNRTGGYDDGFTDFPRVEVRAYAPTYPEAEELAETVRQWLLVLGGEQVEYADGKFATVDFCRTDQPPEDMPYDNPDRVVVPAWYRFGLMRPRR